MLYRLVALLLFVSGFGARPAKAQLTPSESDAFSRLQAAQHNAACSATAASSCAEAAAKLMPIILGDSPMIENLRRLSDEVGGRVTGTPQMAKAIEWGVLERSQIENLKPLKTDPIGRVRFLTTQEEKRIRKALRDRDLEMRERRERYNEHLSARGEKTFPPYPSPYADHLEPLVLILLNTGLRFGEATQLRHSEINLRDRLITVAGEGAKSGRTRVIPMNLEAHRILSSLKGAPGDRIFPGGGGNRLTTIKKSWTALREAAAISGFRLHDLRHTFASRVKRGGADLYAVQRLLGHSSPMMTQRYAHLQPDDLREAVEKVAG